MNTQNLEHVDPVGLATAVSERVQIRDVRLVRCECRQSPDAACVKRFHVTVNSRADTQVNHEASTIAVIVHSECVARDSAKPADSEAELYVSADFAVFYTASSLSGLTKQHLDRFGELNGTFNAWPYWREYLHSTIARMGLKPFVLPVFRIGMGAGAQKAGRRPGGLSQPAKRVRERGGATRG